ncbi:MAG TPA: MBL fold metallo-hydrolase [Gaiellaceae bacterium]|nr:MBL fold metallo-hydrolase [Gaiellaceae bacterium]
MRIRWFGQSAFLLRGAERSVLIDPFGAMGEALAARGMEFRHAPVEGVECDLVLVTHEHGDHNHVAAAVGEPAAIRSAAGRFDSPVGEVVAVASEHDAAAGTQRGPNTIFRFLLDDLAVCHLGDFGQPALRPEQRDALGEVDVLFVPAGGGPTIGGEPAAALVRELTPRLVVPMHYGNEAVSFLEPPDAFLEALAARVERLDGSEAEAEPLLGTRADPVVALLAPPVTPS